MLAILTTATIITSGIAILGKSRKWLIVTLALMLWMDSEIEMIEKIVK